MGFTIKLSPCLAQRGNSCTLAQPSGGPDSFWDEGSNALWVSVVAGFAGGRQSV